MAYVSKRYHLYNSIEVSDHYDCRHVDSDFVRQPKRKRTPVEMQRANQKHREREAERLIWNNFQEGDLFVTLTWSSVNRPEDMKAAQKQFKKFYRKLKAEYMKRYYELFWIANIECTPKGGWHVHVICNDIYSDDEFSDSVCLDVFKGVWTYGHVDIEHLKDRRSKGECVGAYITKTPFSTSDEKLVEEASKAAKENRADREAPGYSKHNHKVRESKYTHSRNLEKPVPEIREISGWKMTRKPRVPKGYYLSGEIVEGINCNGYRYRRYTFLRIDPKRHDRRVKDPDRGIPGRTQGKKKREKGGSSAIRKRKEKRDDRTNPCRTVGKKM